MIMLATCDQNARAQGRFQRVVTTFGIISLLCPAAGVVFGFLAAPSWFKASTAKVKRDDSPYEVGADIIGDDPDNKGQQIFVAATMMKQSGLNKIAAIHAGIAVFLQAAASIIDWMV
jgi:hypothetical protein